MPQAGQRLQNWFTVGASVIQCCHAAIERRESSTLTNKAELNIGKGESSYIRIYRPIPIRC